MTDLLNMQSETMNSCPSFLPQKFWDGDKNEPRLEALSQSYRELEKKVGAGEHRRAPNHHSEYCIECKSELFGSDDGVNERLHKAGFSQEQAQLVYDLAHEALEPLVTEIMINLYAQQQIDRLCEHFGGEERWMEVARQLNSWGRQKLGTNALEAMSSSYDGVLSLYDMMKKGEPGMERFENGSSLNREEDIRKLMRDPKYWRERDPMTVERVREGFRRLYPNS